MIDDEREVRELIEALNHHLPLRAYARAPLVEAMQEEGARIGVNDPVEIDSVLDLGDDGGIGCAIAILGGKTVVVTSLTHLRIDCGHPLAKRIQAYQSRRSLRLADQARRGSRSPTASVATKPKRKKARVVRVEATKKDRVPLRFPRDELLALPLRRETWQVGLVPLDDESARGDEPMRLFGVANVGGMEVRAMTVVDQPLTEDLAWNQLLPAFLNPIEGAPALPAALVVCRREFHEAWTPLLSKIRVRCRYESDPQPVGQLLSSMIDVMAKRQLPPAEGVDIREFPQSDAVWQAGFYRSPAWVMDKQNGPCRPWSVLVLEKSRSNALTTAHAPGDPAPEVLLEFLVRTMARPGGGPAERPRLVEVSDSDCYDHLRPRLEAAGVSCRLADELTEFDDFCLHLARSFDQSEKCALADGPGVTREQMESFYEASNYYFREAPWRRVPGEVPIEIRCDDPAVGTRYGVVSGRTGVQMGLCIYDDWETTAAMLSGYSSFDDNHALAVCYDDEQIMSAVDLQWIDRLGWPIAATDAWPAVLRLEPRRRPRSASAEELVFVDACLRAIPDFLKTRAAPQTRRVATGTRPVELRLAWAGQSTRRA